MAKSGLPPPLPSSFEASSLRYDPARCPASTACGEQMQTIEHLSSFSEASKTTDGLHRLFTWAARERKSFGGKFWTCPIIRLIPFFLWHFSANLLLIQPDLFAQMHVVFFQFFGFSLKLVDFFG